MVVVVDGVEDGADSDVVVAVSEPVDVVVSVGGVVVVDRTSEPVVVVTLVASGAVVVVTEVVVSMTGNGNNVSGDDGRTGNGSPAGGSVAAGFCSTTLYVNEFHCWMSSDLRSTVSTLCTFVDSAASLSWA